jgi:AraC-like DNA-binding protein
MARDARELRGAWATFQRHWYGTPAPDLAPFVSGYWFVEWDLRGQEPYRQKIVPYPNVHLTFLNETATVRGLERGHVVRVLEGRGQVFGVTFRPGCFRPFLGSPVSTLTGRSVPATDVFGPDLPHVTGEKACAPRGEARAVRSEKAGAVASEKAGAVEFEKAGAVASEAIGTVASEKAGAVEDFLRARLPARDPLAETVAAVVEQVRKEPQIARVDALAERSGLGVRRLQRLFAEYVGVCPKWVIRRYRLHEVSERLASGVDIDWVRLAGELGYADQAHFVRDFTAMVGESPTRYAERYPRS